MLVGGDTDIVEGQAAVPYDTRAGRAEDETVIIPLAGLVVEPVVVLPTGAGMHRLAVHIDRPDVVARPIGKRLGEGDGCLLPDRQRPHRLVDKASIGAEEEVVVEVCGLDDPVTGRIVVEADQVAARAIPVIHADAEVTAGARRFGSVGRNLERGFERTRHSVRTRLTGFLAQRRRERLVAETATGVLASEGPRIIDDLLVEVRSGDLPSIVPVADRAVGIVVEVDEVGVRPALAVAHRVGENVLHRVGSAVVSHIGVAAVFP